MKEYLKSIRRSIDTFDDIISRLSSNTETFIPFRDAKLTFILKHALNGNWNTAFIGTIKPSMENYEETIRTLNKIQSVREITNYPKQNVNDSWCFLIQADKIYETLTKNKEYVAKLDPFGGVDSESITILRNPKDTLKLLNERLTELENLPQSFYIRGPLEPIIRFAWIPTDELKEKVKSWMNSFIKFEPMKQIELVDMIVNDQLESEDYEILNVQLKWLDFQFQTFFSQNKVNLSSKNKFHADLYITEYNKLWDDLSDMLKLKTIWTNIPEENTLNVDSAKLQRLKVILLSLKDKNSFIFKIIDSYNNLKLNKMNKTTASMVSQGGTNIKGKLTKLEVNLY